MENASAPTMGGKGLFTNMVSRLGDDPTKVHAVDATPKIMSRLRDGLTNVDAELAPILTKFTAFPRLPKELRLKIWTHTFPKGRYVSLDTYILDKKPNFIADDLFRWGDQDKSNMLEKRQTLPVALFVNGESRAEVLLHYAVVNRRETSERTSQVIEHSSRFKVVPVKPLCFNPKLDKAYMTNDMLWASGPTFGWFDKISLTIPTFFERIETLDIRDFDARPIFAYTGPATPTPASSPVSKGRYIFFAKALLRFKTLKLVRFILTKCCSKLVRKKPEYVRLWITVLTTLFGEQTETWGDSIPKIKLLEYNKVFSSADLKDGKVTMIAGEVWPPTKNRLFLDGEEVFM